MDPDPQQGLCVLQKSNCSGGRAGVVGYEIRGRGGPVLRNVKFCVLGLLHLIFLSNGII